MATAQRARHVHDVDPNCLCVSVIDLVTVCLSHTVTFYRGSPPHSVLRLDVAGRDLTENLVKFATEQECPFSTTAEGETTRDVKERNCAAVVWITTLSSGVRRKLKEKTCGHPDGNIIVGAECFHHCVEKLFQPSFIGKEANRFHEKSTKCDSDIRGSSRSCHVARWLEHVPMDFRAPDEGTDGVGFIQDEDQGGCSARANVVVWIGGSILSSPRTPCGRNFVSFFSCHG